MNEGYEAGVKLTAVTASDTPRTVSVAAARTADAAAPPRWAGSRRPPAPVGAPGRAHDESAAQRGQESDGDGRHRRPVEVLHRRQYLAARRQSDAPRCRLGAGDGARDEEERQDHEQVEQQRPGDYRQPR
jgi:hypothetical protein